MEKEIRKIRCLLFGKTTYVSLDGQRSETKRSFLSAPKWHKEEITELRKQELEGKVRRHIGVDFGYKGR